MVVDKQLEIGLTQGLIVILLAKPAAGYETQCSVRGAFALANRISEILFAIANAMANATLREREHFAIAPFRMTESG